MERMNKEQAQIYLSKYVITKDDAGAIWRKIVFDAAEKIDWEEVVNILYFFNPELENQEYFNSLDLTSR